MEYIIPAEILFYQDGEKNKKQEQEAKAWKKVARNHEILGMLKAGVSANQIAKDFGLSYAGATICARLKSNWDCHRTPG